MGDSEQLDNPAWFTLTGGHAGMAERVGQAARYPAPVSPIAALGSFAPEAFDDLRAVVPDGDMVGLMTRWPYVVPAGWELVQTIPAVQMICEELPTAPEVELVRLGEADVPEMVALATATEPGPFRAGTINMGRYFGLRAEDGRLMAMTGERMRPPGFIEVSAVCTWPEYRGKGLAKTLVSAVSAMIAGEGAQPFLHVKTENVGAIALYEKLGFRKRAELVFKVLKPAP
jgi:ribosomal protein S18 acetylase RimI-like enzyme